MKPKGEKKTRGTAPAKGLRAEIARYEAMTSRQIDDELRRHGVDPQEVVKAVTRLVEEKLRKHRGRDHEDELADRTALPANPVVRLYAMPRCGLLRRGLCPLLGGPSKRHGRSPATLSFQSCGSCVSRRIHPDL
jgi:hypothetical protein